MVQKGGKLCQVIESKIQCPLVVVNYFENCVVQRTVDILVGNSGKFCQVADSEIQWKYNVRW